MDISWHLDRYWIVESDSHHDGFISLPSRVSFKFRSAFLPRLAYQSARRLPSQPLLQQLHWLPVRQLIDYKLAVLTYKIHHTSTPVYLSRHIHARTVTRRFALLLRHESANLLREPTSPTVLFAAPLLLSEFTHCRHR